MSTIDSLQEEWDLYVAGNDTDEHRAAIVKGWCKEMMRVAAESDLTKDARDGTIPAIIDLVANLTQDPHPSAEFTASPKALEAQLVGLRRILGTLHIKPQDALDLASKIKAGNLAGYPDAEGIAVWLNAVGKPRKIDPNRTPRQV